MAWCMPTNRKKRKTERGKDTHTYHTSREYTPTPPPKQKQNPKTHSVPRSPPSWWPWHVKRRDGSFCTKKGLAIWLALQAQRQESPPPTAPLSRGQSLGRGGATKNPNERVGSILACFGACFLFSLCCTHLPLSLSSLLLGLLFLFPFVVLCLLFLWAQQTFDKRSHIRPLRGRDRVRQVPVRFELPVEGLHFL